jgi:hypothetical protein
MVRFAEPGFTNTDSKHLVNAGRSELLPPSVQISPSKQNPKKSRQTVTAAFPRRHTRSMTTDAARKAVFNTSELLENIISFLPPRDILTKVQRLSRQWKNAVESSPAIKNKFWMTSGRCQQFSRLVLRTNTFQEIQCGAWAPDQCTLAP